MKEVAKLQKDYQNLIDKNKLTKKDMCDLVIPFRDKYELKDAEALRVARDGMSLSDTIDLLEKSIGASYSMRKWVVKRPNDTAVITLMQNESDGRYIFVNLTEGRICIRKFNTVYEALEYLEECKRLGKITEYYEL